MFKLKEPTVHKKIFMRVLSFMRVFSKLPSKRENKLGPSTVATQEFAQHGAAYAILKYQFGSKSFYDSEDEDAVERFEFEINSQIRTAFTLIRERVTTEMDQQTIEKLCINNAAYSSRAARGSYFARRKKETERWGHKQWQKKELDWHFAIFSVALFLPLARDLSINPDDIFNILKTPRMDEDMRQAIQIVLRNADAETSPKNFGDVINHMYSKIRCTYLPCIESKAHFTSSH